MICSPGCCARWVLFAAQGVLRLLVCQNVDGTNYLVVDFNLTCSGEKWVTYAGVNTIVSSISSWCMLLALAVMWF